LSPLQNEIIMDGGGGENNNDDALFSCAICGTSEGDSSNLTSQSSLQTNATVRCGHQFCNSCIDRELVRRREFPCPLCGNPVKRVTLTQRTLDDVQCEKDTSWRRRVLKVFNKTEKDFPTLLEYNDYLEQVEDMIYSIVNEDPEAETNKIKIREYEQRHKAEIVVRQSQRADEERSIQDQIAGEQREAERLRREALEEERAIAAAKRKLKQESTQVLLGEREEVSAELRAAQMQGYRNELKRQALGRRQPANFVSPRVREPEGGWVRESKMDPDLYRKRQAAGGGIPVGSIASYERNWNETVSTLFSKPGGRGKRPQKAQQTPIPTH
jgi:CDK-activating kinase assembly factor MAT1